MSDAAEFFFTVAIVIFVIFVIASCRENTTSQWWRDEIKRRGHGEYFLNDQNEKHFRWKEATK